MTSIDPPAASSDRGGRWCSPSSAPLSSTIPLLLPSVTEVPPFQPLADRLAGLPQDETLHDGVPDWLDQPLRDWLESTFKNEGAAGAERLASRVLMRLRWAKHHSRQSYVQRLDISSGMELLYVVDAVLQLHPGWDQPDPYGFFQSRVLTLDEILTDSASLYRIDQHARRLIHRVDTTVQAAVDTAITTAAPTAADHLHTAWVAAYGFHPDPDKAYDHAILAIEELTCPLVSPQNSKGTLGTVIRDLRNQVTQWELSIGDTTTGRPAAISSLIEMLDLLWKGQSRHAGNSNSRQQTQAEAEAAVHMAAALTQWLTAGVLRRK
jgi:hypothetical protein